VASVSVGMSGCLDTDGEEENPTPNGGDTNQPDEPNGDGQNSTRKKERILELYNTATEANNRGVELQGRAIDAFENKDYGRSASLYGDAQSKFSEAESKVSEAYNIALEIGHDEAQMICEEAMEYARLYFQAARAGKNSADAASNDNIERANELTNKANSYTDKANRKNPRSPAEFKEILGV